MGRGVIVKKGDPKNVLYVAFSEVNKVVDEEDKYFSERQNCIFSGKSLNFAYNSWVLDFYDYKSKKWLKKHFLIFTWSK